MKLKRFLGAAFTLCSCFVATASAMSLAWFINNSKTNRNQNVNGQLGLRNYFYAGTGEVDAPFEIVLPVHFYNLSRLQNLGIFANEVYFRVGHDFAYEAAAKSSGITGAIRRYGDDGSYQCLNGDGEKVGYLDMAGYSSRILSIGGEGSPFYGRFDGEDIPVQNLSIVGDPEDIGVFGYVAAGATVEHFIVENLTVTSNGYTTNTSSEVYDLFHPEIDRMFEEDAHFFAKDAGLTFYPEGDEPHDMKGINGESGKSYMAIDAGFAEASKETPCYMPGYFKPTFPKDESGSGVKEKDKYTYSWRFSTKLFEKDPSDPLKARINLNMLRANSSFNAGVNGLYETRISLIASITIDGYTYSRVIQTYLAQFYSHYATESDFGTGKYEMRLFCDYVASAGYANPTKYHHGNNIGYLAGHVDGIMSNCYVYNGTLVFNDAELTPIYTESETGLIGEIGSNVSNEINPDIGLVVNGDTGVMNFTKIYQSIRDDAKVGDVLEAYKGYGNLSATEAQYIYYNNYTYQRDNSGNIINDEDGNPLYKSGFTKYQDFLRCDRSLPPHYVAKLANGTSLTKVGTEFRYTVQQNQLSRVNTVDFKENQVITKSIDENLGVFELATAHNDGDTYFIDYFDKSKIVNGEAKTKVYYSTAEWDRVSLPADKWKKLVNVATTPSYCDTSTMSKQYEKDFDYIFEMDLSQMNDRQYNKANYFWNTDNAFLSNYLSYKLRDKYGQRVEAGTNRFGFMFRSSENDLMSSLSSYMPVSVPSTLFEHTDSESGETKLYPSSTITFRIENANGANVSVVGANDDITIYSYDPDPSTGQGSVAPYATMHSAVTSDGGSDGTIADSCLYYKYDVIDGTTSSVVDSEPITSSSASYGSTESLTREDKLFAHIFYLPQGDYCIGAQTTTANIYFLAVQGQTEGTIDSTPVYDTGNGVENVDFLLRAYSASRMFDYSYFSFKAEFNSQRGTINTNADSSRVIGVTFDESTRVFVSYLLLYKRENLEFFIDANGNKETLNQKTYIYREAS